MSPTKAKSAVDGDDAEGGEPLKRLGGGRWQTRDERFTIEPQSGTWSVVDVAETDDFGLPLVRGPFKSLTDAKAAIAAARSGEQPASPLAGRLEAATPGAAEGRRAAERGRPEKDAPKGRTGDRKPAEAGPARRKPGPEASVQSEEPEEPGWFRDLSPAVRGRARRLIERLTADGVADAAGIVRRDLAGDVPALAAHAIGARLAGLDGDATRNEIVNLLVEGRDDSLGVRWRLVDGDGRPITIDAPGTRRRRGG